VRSFGRDVSGHAGTSLDKRPARQRWRTRPQRYLVVTAVTSEWAGGPSLVQPTAAR